MRKNFVIAISVVLAMLVPLVTTAAVVVNNNIDVSVSNFHPNQVYLTAGPAYRQANSSGYIGIVGDNSKFTNTTVTLNSIPGTGYVVMTNVLEVYNDSTSNSPVYIWFNGSIPSGVFIYYSSSLMTFTGDLSGNLGGVALISGSNGPIHISGQGVVLYLSIVTENAQAGTFSLNMQVS